jgi:hypothetical protein
VHFFFSYVHLIFFVKGGGKVLTCRGDYIVQRAAKKEIPFGNPGSSMGGEVKGSSILCVDSSGSVTCSSPMDYDGGPERSTSKIQDKKKDRQRDYCVKPANRQENLSRQASPCPTLINTPSRKQESKSFEISSHLFYRIPG